MTTNKKITSKIENTNKLNITAVLNKNNKTSLTATLDPVIIKQAKMNLYELAIQNGFNGSFDDFLSFFKLDMTNLSDLISLDDNNGLVIGSDNKLYTPNTLTQLDW